MAAPVGIKKSLHRQGEVNRSEHPAIFPLFLLLVVTLSCSVVVRTRDLLVGVVLGLCGFEMVSQLARAGCSSERAR